MKKKIHIKRFVFLHFGILLACISFATSSVYAMKEVDGDNGKVLVLEEKYERNNVDVTGVIVRDPFNWSPEVVQKYKAVFDQMVADTFKGFVLSGIIFNQEIPMAIVDKNLVQVGDMLGDIEVLQISRNSVVLKKGVEEHTLNFEELIIDLHGASSVNAFEGDVQ